MCTAHPTVARVQPAGTAMWDPGQRRSSTAGQLDNIPLLRIEQMHHLLGVLGAEATALDVRRVELDRHREARGLDATRGTSCQRTSVAIQRSMLA